jgi:hypothetical protein
MKPTLRKVMATAALALALASTAGLVDTSQAQAAAAPAGCRTTSPTTWYWAAEQRRESGWCIQASGNYLVMQADGNFVLYAGSTALWSTQTQPYNGLLWRWQTQYIAFQVDGNIVVRGDRYNVPTGRHDYEYPGWAASSYGGWFAHRGCPANTSVTKFGAQIHPAGGGRGLHVDFGTICSNGGWYNNFAIDPNNVAAPGVRPYR